MAQRYPTSNTKTSHTSAQQATTARASGAGAAASASSTSSASASSTTSDAKFILLDGKKIAAERRVLLHHRIIEFAEKNSGLCPGLAVVLVGDHPPSQIYVAHKIKACHAVGIKSFLHRFPADIDEDKLVHDIQSLCQNPEIHAVLVQLPLPSHIRQSVVLSALDPRKDVDGLTVENLGLLWSGTPRVAPCTPAGIMVMLEKSGVKIEGSHAVVIGRSNIVGKPMAQLLLNAGATVTTCHRQTVDLLSYTRQADIVVVAAGQPRFLGRDAFKRGAVVIDVGIHRVPNKHDPSAAPSLVGDVRGEEIVDWVRAASPVPGGVGPMTIQMLLENTYALALQAGAQ